ncbi:MAG TPA: T9SS type A sorting domain-containing protein [Bacteroidia bacterium]|nr:T9SS type A sorting domain-containing protein [Bacteroidia bacterium]
MFKNKIYVTKSSLFPSGFMGLIFLSGLFFGDKPVRQYSPDNTVKKQIANGAQETRDQYFFNARKTPGTNTIDYVAMLKCQQIIESDKKFHRALSSMGLYWNPLGPDNIGGQTRALLIDKNDPTGQTLFAGGVAGGLWKSVNGGNSWDSTAVGISNDCISCIAQDSSGAIFVGTGAGFSLYYQGQGFGTSQLGAGIYKSVDDGATFNVLPATVPTQPDNDVILWAYTDRVAIISGSPDIIYAGTNAGLMVSTDGGNTFNYATNSTGKMYGNTLDVKTSDDKKLVLACYNGTAYYAYTGVSATNFTQVHKSGYDSLPSSGGGRIEFGIAPGNSNYAYASVIGSNGNLIGIYMTKDAVSSGIGGNWHKINNKSVDPYSLSGSYGQGTYDNAIGIFPNNPGKVIFGGIVLWSWTQTSPGDTIGTWANLSNSNVDSIGLPRYVHRDDHVIAIAPDNKTMYIGCDGGVYKSTDGAQSFQQYDNGYNVTEFYSIAIPADTYYNEGVLAGSQDNGTIYIPGSSWDFQYGHTFDYSDGGQCAISSLNANICYSTAPSGNILFRSDGLTSLITPTGGYNTTSGFNKGANIDSVANLGSGCYVTPLALYENPYDTTTLDSLNWIADKAYNAGDTIFPVSPNGNMDFQYVLSKAVAKNAIVKLQNRVISKIATAFSANNGVWMMMQAADFNDQMVWMPIGGPLSLPDAFKGTDPVHCMAWSPNGDALFVGTEGGQLFRFSNLDSIIDNVYTTGALFSQPGGANHLTRVKSKSLTSAINLAGADILSISVDPKNGNHMVVTVGGYTGGTHVYYCSNALSTNPGFVSAQGNLPEMPVYGSIIDIINSPYPNGALLATEHGVYSTPDVTAASPVWSADNNRMDNTITLAIKQQTLPPWNCNNSGKVYIATGGRGLYVDSTFFVPTGINQLTNNVGIRAGMKIYPNPMNGSGTIAFIIPESEKVTITIYDMQGRVVKEIPVADRTPGNHTVSINTKGMVAGTYIATITGNNFKCSGRFVVVR